MKNLTVLQGPNTNQPFLPGFNYQNYDYLK